MDYKNITVAGCGVLGSQIAFQTAYKGYKVSVYDITEPAIEQGKERIRGWFPYYGKDLGADAATLEEAFGRMSFHSNLEEAVKDADLVIETVPERPEIKTGFYQKLAEAAPEKTVFVSNSSTMLPSRFAEVTGRPEKFLNLHFANEIWKNNTAEVMGHAGTDEEVFNDIVGFAKSIGMVALPLNKEQPGYILNSLLVPLLDAAQKLLANGVSDPATIDKTWMIATGAPKGPFAILDVVGVTTAYNITEAKAQGGDPEARKIADMLKQEYIDKGKLGRASGEGFYKYPNPAYADPDFLKE